MTASANDAFSAAVQSARQRAVRYWDIDGLRSILAGLVSLFFGLETAILQKLGQFFGVAGGALLGLCLAFGVFWLGLNEKEILDRIKQRVTYPRTGFVPGPASAEDVLFDSSPSDLRRALFSLDVLCLIPSSIVWVILIAGLAVSVWIRLTVLIQFVLTTALLKRKRGRSIELGATVCFVAGFGYCFLTWPRTSVHVACAIYGAGLVLVGVYRLALYLRSNPRPAQTGS